MAASGIPHLTLAERRSLFRTRNAWLGMPKWWPAWAGTARRSIASLWIGARR
jgi:hypothetical protein